MINNLANSITIRKGYKTENLNQVLTRHPFFDSSEFTYHTEDDCLVFRRPDIDDNKYIITAHKSKEKRKDRLTIYVFHIKTIEIPFGNYEIEEDKDEDCLYVYYGQ